MPVSNSTTVTSTSPASRASAAQTAVKTLRPGSEGALVKKLQSRLNRLGMKAGGADGQYGPMTTAAVKRFQQAKGLPASGVADARTQSVLRKAISQQHAAKLKERIQLFSAPVLAENRKLAALGTQLDRFTQDGTVTGAEKRALLKGIATAVNGAEGLPSHQADPTLKLLSQLKLVTQHGKLTEKAEAYEKKLLGQRQRLRAQAKHDATHGTINRHGFKTRYHGVATRDFTWKGLKVHAVAIDLADPRVRLETNSSGQRGRTVESQAKAHGAEVAINGDFFTYATHKPSGLAKTNGTVWKDTKDNTGFEPSLAFTGRHAQVLDAFHHGEPKWADNVVSARPQVLKDGKVMLSPGDMNHQSSRTGLGVSRSGRTMYMVAVEGRSGVYGLTAVQVGELLKKLGADDAIAMDGGGSAQMYQRGRGVVHRSTDGGAGRPVANTVMVQSR